VRGASLEKCGCRCAGGAACGVKVMRYEIKNINPPQDVLAAMEKQMRAEREKRAVILTSEGARDAAINNAEGIRRIAESIQNPGGFQAVQLRVAEQYIQQFGNLAKAGNTLVVPTNLADVGALVTMAMNVVKSGNAQS
jgi:regulator of protease activity HflC (stomatin/prohibitin superfamily)